MIEAERLGDPDVTVLIAAYNCEQFIERALHSALDQADVCLEVVVVDDCSTDRTIEVVQDLAKIDRRIRLVTMPENGGPGAARSRGIDEARGEWIAVLDADDAFTPGRLHRLLAIGRSESADLVADNWCYFDAKSGEVTASVLAARPAVEILSLEGFVSRARPYQPEPDYGLLKPVIRRDFLGTTGVRYPAGVRHGEDFEFVFDILEQGARFALVRDLCGYLYTTRASGWSKTLIDDAGLINRSKALLKRPAVLQDSLLRASVSNRINALQTMELDRFANLPVHVRPRGLMLRRALSSWQGWKWMAAKIRRKLNRS